MKSFILFLSIILGFSIAKADFQPEACLAISVGNYSCNFTSTDNLTHASKTGTTPVTFSKVAPSGNRNFYSVTVSGTNTDGSTWSSTIPCALGDSNSSTSSVHVESSSLRMAGSLSMIHNDANDNIGKMYADYALTKVSYHAINATLDTTTWNKQDKIIEDSTLVASCQQ